MSEAPAVAPDAAPAAAAPAAAAAAAPDTYVAPDGTKYARIADDGSAKPPPATTEAPAAPATSEGGAADPVVAAADKAPLKLGEEKPAEKPGETKPGETKPGEIAKGSDYKLTLPEGVKADDTLAAFLDTAAAQKLTNDQVNALVADFAPKYAQAFANQMREGWASTITQWQTDFAADPEIGGDKQATVVSTVTAALRKFGAVVGADGKSDLSPVQKFLNDTGAHSNPVFARVIFRMAQQLGEGTPVSTTASGQGGPGAKPPADVMYPKTAAQMTR